MKTEDRKKLGKKSRAQGAIFEKRVFEDLKARGWTVSRWPNKVEVGKVEDVKGLVVGGIQIKKWVHGKLVQAKAKWINGRVIGMNGGFPDFIAIVKVEDNPNLMIPKVFQVLAIECKTNNQLDKAEREQLNWYLENKTFSKIIIAYKTKKKNRVKINYREFEKNL